jgi:HK97 family phage major capsid protein
MAIIERGFQDEFPSEQFKEKLRGTGAGEPEGILNSPATLLVGNGAGNALRETAATITGGDIVQMRSRVWNYNRSIWITNHDCLPALASAHIEGTNGDRFLFAPGTTLPGTGPGNNDSVDVPDQLLGRPIFFSEYASSIGTVGDLICGVWSEYLWGTLQAGPQMAESIHVRFLEHERTFKFFLRNDGRSWWRTALTPVLGKTLSPFVSLPLAS